MSPLGLFLLSMCDNDMRINLNNHWTALSRYGSHLQVEARARMLGLTMIGIKHTVMGMPAVRV